MIPQEQLQQQLAKFGNWMYKFQLTDEIATPVHAEWLPEIHETRSKMIFPFLDSFFADRWAEISCLDAACNEGFFSFELCRRGANRVIGFDVRPESIEKANFIREFYNYTQVSFCVDEIANLSAIRYGAFDLTLFLGILYHLENPMDVIRRIRAVTKTLCVIDTQILKGDPVVTTCWGSADNVYQLQNVIGIVEEKDFLTNPCASSTGLGFVPSRAALFTMLTYAGFSKVTQLMPYDNCFEQYANLDRIIVVAEV